MMANKTGYSGLHKGTFYDAEGYRLAAYRTAYREKRPPFGIWNSVPFSEL